MFGFKLVKISGSSMEPRLRSGDFALFRRRPTYAIGDIVLVHHPHLGPIVKQIKTLQNGQVTLEGTGVYSTSTEKMGVVAVSAIRGKMVWHFKQD